MSLLGMTEANEANIKRNRAFFENTLKLEDASILRRLVKEKSVGLSYYHMYLDAVDGLLTIEWCNVKPTFDEQPIQGCLLEKYLNEEKNVNIKLQHFLAVRQEDRHHVLQWYNVQPNPVSTLPQTALAQAAKEPATESGKILRRLQEMAHEFLRSRFSRTGRCVLPEDPLYQEELLYLTLRYEHERLGLSTCYVSIIARALSLFHRNIPCSREHLMALYHFLELLSITPTPRDREYYGLDRPLTKRKIDDDDASVSTLLPGSSTSQRAKAMRCELPNDRQSTIQCIPTIPYPEPYQT